MPGYVSDNTKCAPCREARYTVRAAKEEDSMVDVIAKSSLQEVIWAQLDPEGDVYDEIMEICRRENIVSGLVLNIVGGLRKARLSMPINATDFEAQPGVLELTGMM